MKNIISFLVLSLFFTGHLYSQCISNSEYGSYVANNSGFIESVSTLVSPGKYMTISNILENEYTFTAIHSVVTNDYIVLTDSSDNILEQGVSPISYTFMPGDITGGIIRLHLFLDADCNTDDINLSVTILNETVAPTTCQLPENPGVSYRSDIRIDFNWEAPSIGDTPSSYDWEAVPAGNAQGVGVVDSGNTIANNASATGLTNNTSYVFYIRSNCGVNGNSDWYSTPPLKTNLGPPPANDFCSGAISVVQDTNTDIDPITIINGTLLNTAGTDILAEQCSGNTNDNARDDIWYSFLAQTTDVTITLDPLFNGILTLLSDCNAAFILDCSDNNGSGVPRSEEITYNSLIVNETYYVRVYYQGFATSTPNFTLKIWSATFTDDDDDDGFADSVDCDDADANAFPGNIEICDGIDNNCDGNIDEGLTFDVDGDGYTAIGSCNGSADDCNDNDAAINPGASEVCDGVDNNCDGNIDEGLTFDVDGDGYTAIGSCNGSADDCNDNDAAINPGVSEVCDGIDNNCDGNIDEGLTFDVDGDGYTAIGSCNGSADDCNDNDADVYPGASEVCNGVDNNCDGNIDEGLTFDFDGDGFTAIGSCNGSADDCNDNDASIYPGADEIPNDGIDQDCDGNDLIIVPVNDNLCDAIGLIVGNSTSGGTYTNVAATIQVSEPDGICWSNSDLATSTVWFSFVSPASGELDISTDFNDGTLSNTQLSLYSVSNCNDLATLTPLFCNDDISGSNFLSLVEATGLTSGNTYYLQVDGYNDEKGTFDIGLIETTLGTQDVEEGELFQFYPNPVNDILTIKSRSNIKHFSVFSILGERVNYESLDTSIIDIDMSKLNAGLYIVNVVTDKGTKVIKVFKE